MTTRADVAAALSTVDGVQGYAYRPAAPREGDAWPTLQGFERGSGGGAATFYTLMPVLIVLPADERSASQWIDARVSALLDALETVAYVVSMEPAVIATSEGDRYAFKINLRGE